MQILHEHLAGLTGFQAFSLIVMLGYLVRLADCLRRKVPLDGLNGFGYGVILFGILIALAGCKKVDSASHHCVYDLGGTARINNCHSIEQQTTYNDQPMNLQFEQCDIVCVITSMVPSEKAP